MAIFQVILGQTVPPWFCFSTCFRKERCGISKCKAVPYFSEEFRRDAHLPLVSREPVVDKPLKSVTHGQCDARPTVIFPALRHHRPFDRYQLILLGDKGTWVWTTCLRSLLNSDVAGNWSHTFNTRLIHCFCTIFNGTTHESRNQEMCRLQIYFLAERSPHEFQQSIDGCGVFFCQQMRRHSLCVHCILLLSVAVYTIKRQCSREDVFYHML